MMRALWSAASGMKGQQTAVDTIANNLANVNTTGYKSQSTQFASLLYQTIKGSSTNADGDNKPTSIQVGLGTRVSSINTSFTQGAMTANDSNTAFCLSGEGFFALQNDNGETVYTRNGNFSWAIAADGSRVLTSPEGYKVLDQNNKPITIPNTAGTEGFTVDTTGVISYRDDTGNYVTTGQVMAVYQFPNRVGLDKIGDNLYEETQASGEAEPEWNTKGITASTIHQNYLEASNVNVADEMVNLIIAQRAYEMNSKAITTSDTMLEQANNLKR